MKNRAILCILSIFSGMYAVMGDPFELILRPGWNLISVPIEPEDSTLFESLTDLAEGPLWEWDGGGWRVADAVRAGTGYALHVKVDATGSDRLQTTVTVFGDAVEGLRLAFTDGWNFLGPLAEAPFDALPLPLGYGFPSSVSGRVWAEIRGGYCQAAQLRLGCAYWFFALEPGEVCFGRVPFAGDYLIIDLSDGPSASSYPVSSLDSLPDPIPDVYKTTKLVLRRIPAGTFTMGSPTDELGRWDGHEQQHQVTLTQDFYMGVFEVTQRQWERVMGSNPSHFSSTRPADTYGALDGHRPVENVSYDEIRGSSAGAGWPADNCVDATCLLGRLREKTQLILDLPTEAQWEYACRAGTTSALNSGKTVTSENGFVLELTTDAQRESACRLGTAAALNRGMGLPSEYGHCMNLEPLGWFDCNANSSFWSEPHADRLGTQPVGRKIPNAWGLYDMHGNVWEWCLDWHDADLGGDPVIDPVGGSGGFRALRGGSWGSNAGSCRSASRGGGGPDLWGNVFGLRVSCPPPAQ